MIVREGPARLADAVPVARALATRLACESRKRQEELGHAVPCKKDCSACCKYLVPLSVPEAFRLAQDVLALEASSRDRTEEAMAVATDAILQADPPPLHLCDCPEGEAPSHTVGRWYASLELSCPLLAGDLCSFYSRRPIACREHMVISPPVHCEGFHPERGELVDAPFSLTEALGRLASRMEQHPLEAVMLPLALEWAAHHLYRGQCTWPAEELFAGFAGIISEMAEEAGIRLAVA